VANTEPQIVFAGGGTGGHLYPALALAAELRERHPSAKIWFIGARRGLEQRLVPQAGYRLRSLGVSGIKGRGVAAKFVAALSAGWAVCRCAVWLLAARPDLVIGVGGYASGPAMLAATLLRIRTMVMEQNHYPGATNRWLAPRVDAVCAPSDAALDRLGKLRGLGVVTGNPVRAEFTTLGDPPLGDVPAILVFGGSRGAHSINVAITEAAPMLASAATPPRLCLQTGVDDEEMVRRAFRDYPDDRIEIRSFIDDMPTRLERADLVVCRAGASTLSELAAAGRAAILVPYPHAADDHQRHNAETMSDAGAAVVILHSDLHGKGLAERMLELSKDHVRLRKMSEAAKRLALPNATQAIADVADDLLEPTAGKRGADVS
jgi:UDP-N-acetylglucosamine--N-acetylmuramyl-(pentapeptide) pyrophosphoryl-undecaprenol N-acetylglucosamine transferase